MSDAVGDEVGAVPVGEAAAGVRHRARIPVDVVVAGVAPGGRAEEVAVVRHERVRVLGRAVVVAVVLVIAVVRALGRVVGPDLRLVVAALRGGAPLVNGALELTEVLVDLSRNGEVADHRPRAAHPGRAAAAG